MSSILLFSNDKNDINRDLQVGLLLHSNYYVLSSYPAVSGVKLRQFNYE